MILNQPDTRPITDWRIEIDIDDDLTPEEVQRMIAVDELTKEWLALGMEYEHDETAKLGRFATSDPWLAAVLVEDFGIVWQRDEIPIKEVADDDPVRAYGFRRKGKYHGESGAYISQIPNLCLSKHD